VNADFAAWFQIGTTCAPSTSRVPSFLFSRSHSVPILPFDDLQTGRFVTVHSLQEANAGYTDNPAEVAMARAQRRKSPVPMGVPIEVLALNAPFVLGAPVLPGGATAGPVFLDTREVRLMPVPEGLVKVLRERFKPAPSMAEILGSKGGMAAVPVGEVPQASAEDEACDGEDE
jgi:hypothetical protein